MTKFNNLFINTSFQQYRKSWLTNNCELKQKGNSLVISSKQKLFGISQDFLLSQSGRYYVRLSVESKTPIKQLHLGIKEGNKLELSTYKPFSKVKFVVSIIVDREFISDTNVHTLCLIAESSSCLNELIVSEPMLIRLDDYELKFAMKDELDKKVPYSKGITIENCLPFSTVNKTTLTEKGYWEVFKASGENVYDNSKDGAIIDVGNKFIISQQVKLPRNDTLLFKVLGKALNSFGVCRIYINEKCFEFRPNQSIEQYYVIGHSIGLNTIKVELERKGLLKFTYNLLKMLLVDLSKYELSSICEKDIERIPFL